MAQKIKTQRSKSLKSKFRFVILNDETFEEKFSLVLSNRNVWLFGSIVAFTLIFLTAAAIVYTPLKYFIPGFGDYNYRGEILRLKFKTDSLETQLEARQIWLDNLINVANGTVDTTRPPQNAPAAIDKSKINLTETSREDKDLRKEVEEEENFSLSATSAQQNEAIDEVKQMHLLQPVTGYVTQPFSLKDDHFGLDIATKMDEPVKAVLNGKVISAGYTFADGYVITIQHAQNLISVYKHNARLLKKTGEEVKAGDVIAFAGTSGETSTGPHLHFELWHQGKAINPKDYILF